MHRLRSLLPTHTPRPQVIFKKMGRQRSQATEPPQDGDGTQHPLRSVESGVPTGSYQWQCDSGQGLVALMGPWLTLSPCKMAGSLSGEKRWKLSRYQRCPVMQMERSLGKPGTSDLGVGEFLSTWLAAFPSLLTVDVV